MVPYFPEAISFLGKSKHVISQRPPSVALYIRVYKVRASGCEKRQHGGVWQLKCLVRQFNHSKD